MKNSLKKAIVLLLVLAMMSGSIMLVSATEEDGAALIPVRSFFEELGADVAWDDENWMITITLEDNVYMLFVDNNIAVRNDNVVVLENNVIIEDSRSYIALVDLQTLMTPGYLSGAIGTAGLAAEQIIEYYSVPGITIAIVDAENGFTWTGGFGYADVDGDIPVDEYTLFGLASISKTFTATAIMQLVEAGILDLDEPIVTYLPDMSMLPDILTGEGDYRNITARMLLAHASGIYSDFMGFGVATIDAPNPDYMNDFLENLATFPMEAPEASVFTYANNSITLLGVLIAEIMGYDDAYEGYADYMQTNVFTPIGMDLSTFILDDVHLEHLAQPYIDATLRDEFIYYNALPAGGIFSNADDMSRFMLTLLNDGAYSDEGSRVLAPGSVSQMFELADFGFEAPLTIIHPGMGILHSEGLDGFRYTGHGGNLVHYHSSMVFDRDNNLGVFVSTNSITGMAVVESIAVLILQTAIMEKTGSLDLPESDPTVEPISLTEDELLDYVGIYMIVGSDRLAYVVLEEDELYLVNLSGAIPTINLVPLSDGSFINPDLGLRLWFVDYEGEMLLFLGEFMSQPAGGRLESEYFDQVATEEDISDLIGVYLPIMEEGEVSIIASVTVGVDDNGFGYASLTALHGNVAFTLLIPIDDNSYLGGLSFVFEGDNVFLEFAGLTMMLIE